ncbi:hypothetical protein [Vibrio fluvialis]|uniref:hypothetical protein n=2 Tax=Vibrio fluvialis TaxID=676 RepID=UPI001C9CD504|nr:hypothetical protein [Vibrio fluvialis]MBY7767334.1 hypothetical protein [Vibrio fluvialis]MBY8152490.1 hypothetical protein [Vibrio fluvialis]MCE7595860.1 hypothetical protein [Vibrio fluvialis]
MRNNKTLSFFMKCTNCHKLKPFECGGFPTHDDFLRAQAKIEEMKASGELKSLNLYDFQCAACLARWELAYPDNAYRGFLRVVSERAQKIESLRKKYKT